MPRYGCLAPDRSVEPRILEIGCGSGHLLDSLAALGFRSLRGVDIAPAAVRSARKRLAARGLGDCVSYGTARDVIDAGGAGQYDLLLLCDVLEHLPPDHIDSFLTDVNSLLSKEGVLVVVTPNAMTGPHDLTRHFLPLSKGPVGLHLHEYSLRQLANVLSAAGFGDFRGIGPLSWYTGVPFRHLSGLGTRIKLRLEPLLSMAPQSIREIIMERLLYQALAARKLATAR
ncbi:MAG: class I SAM-dependent methyltransferase [Pseudonocardiaceae bacterium]